MSNTAKILKLTYNSAEATKDVALKTDYLSVRLIKISGTLDAIPNSYTSNILLNGKCLDPENRKLYVFYVDTYYNSAWIIEIGLDDRVLAVVYYDKTNAIGFDPGHKIYNARVVHGKLVWTDGQAPIYQMDIARAKKSFYYKIGYGHYTTVAEWLSTTSYAVDQIVSNGTYFYKSLVDGNSGHEPRLDAGVHWEKLCLVEDAYYSQNIENFYFEAMPPKTPPTVKYISDDTRRINSLKQTLFQFAYRYVYMDWRKSTFSPASVVALPSGEEEVNTGLANEQISINNGLEITVNTGGEEVRAIEVIARSSIDKSKWYLIETINKFDEEERGGEISLLVNAEYNTITISVPAVTVSNINIADPDGSVPFEISVPAPSVLIYWISPSVASMTWDADESGVGDQIASIITVTGDHPTTQLSHIPTFVTVIETARGTTLSEGDPIADGIEIAIYPTADNTGPYKNDNLVISDVYGNFCNIFVEQNAPLDVPVVNIIVHPESPNEMTLSEESGIATLGSTWLDITFTPNHPLYGSLVNFTMNYQIWNGVLVGSGNFIASNMQSNNKLLSMSSAPLAGETVTVYLWEGTIT